MHGCGIFPCVFVLLLLFFSCSSSYCIEYQISRWDTHLTFNRHWLKKISLCLFSKCYFAFAKTSTTMDLKEKQGKCFTSTFVLNMLSPTDSNILLTLVQLVQLSSVRSNNIDLWLNIAPFETLYLRSVESSVATNQIK